MGIKALTNDKKLAKLIYKSVLKSADKKYPANVRLDVMLEFIDSLKVTLEGLMQKQAKKDEKEDIVSISTIDVTKLDEPEQALLVEAKNTVDKKEEAKKANKKPAEEPASTEKEVETPSDKKSKSRSKKKSKK